MRKILFGLTLILINTYSFANCSVGVFSDNTSIHPENYSIIQQKLLAKITTTASQMKISTPPLHIIPNDIVAFEVEIETPKQLNSNETIGFYIGAITNGLPKKGLGLFIDKKAPNILQITAIPLGIDLLKNTSFFDLSSQTFDRVGFYINTPSKKIGLMINGVNKGYLWKIDSNDQNLNFSVANTYSDFKADSTQLNQHATIQLITDHSLMTQTYPVNTHDICGHTL